MFFSLSILFGILFIVKPIEVVICSHDIVNCSDYSFGDPKTMYVISLMNDQSITSIFQDIGMGQINNIVLSEGSNEEIDLLNVKSCENEKIIFRTVGNGLPSNISIEMSENQVKLLNLSNTNIFFSKLNFYLHHIEFILNDNISRITSGHSISYSIISYKIKNINVNETIFLKRNSFSIGNDLYLIPQNMEFLQIFLDIESAEFNFLTLEPKDDQIFDVSFKFKILDKIIEGNPSIKDGNYGKIDEELSNNNENKNNKNNNSGFLLFSLQEIKEIDEKKVKNSITQKEIGIKFRNFEKYNFKTRSMINFIQSYFNEIKLYDEPLNSIFICMKLVNETSGFECYTYQNPITTDVVIIFDKADYYKAQSNLVMYSTITDFSEILQKIDNNIDPDSSVAVKIFGKLSLSIVLKFTYYPKKCKKMVFLSGNSETYSYNVFPNAVIVFEYLEVTNCVLYFVGHSEVDVNNININCGTIYGRVHLVNVYLISIQSFQRIYGASIDRIFLYIDVSSTLGIQYVSNGCILTQGNQKISFIFDPNLLAPKEMLFYLRFSRTCEVFLSLNDLTATNLFSTKFILKSFYNTDPNEPLNIITSPKNVKNSNQKKRNQIKKYIYSGKKNTKLIISGEVNALQIIVRWETETWAKKAVENPNFTFFGDQNHFLIDYSTMCDNMFFINGYTNDVFNNKGKLDIVVPPSVITTEKTSEPTDSILNEGNDKNKSSKINYLEGVIIGCVAVFVFVILLVLFVLYMVKNKKSQVAQMSNTMGGAM